MIPAPAPDALRERLRGPGGRRTIALALALAIEGLLLFLLLSLGVGRAPPKGSPDIAVVDLRATDYAGEPLPQPADEPPQPDQPAPQQDQRVPEPPPTPPEARAEANPPVTPPPVDVLPAQRPAPPAPSTDVYPRPIQALPQGTAIQGPPDRRGPAVADTAVVGTAPDGEPLYAAAWYREPADDELRGYLSTAMGPGWGLIACRTAPDFRVEDCVGLAEYPQGSLINRAILAAAWQFKVRPPRLGGRPQIGAWVRIRIEYGVTRR